jgi:uncharacterized peroxidase-related enzyme
MALIPPPDLEDLPPEVRSQYEQHRQEHAHFDQLRLSLARFPAALRAADGMYRQIMNEGRLGRTLREQIFLVASGVRGCGYAESVHGGWLVANTGMTRADVGALRKSAPTIDRRGEALLGFARKVAAAPYKTVSADFDRLREAGWEIPDIVEALSVVSLSGWMNGYADALGLEAPDEVGAPDVPERS